MRRRLSALLLSLWLLAIALPQSVWAQGPITPQQGDPNWSTAYWNNMELTGAPVLVRSESNINYNWGTGSPDPAVSDDQFSARWMRYVQVSAGTYRFTVTSDDGVRLWVDDVLILDEWNDHAETTYFVDHTLTSGYHLIRMDYYENTGLAVARLTWARADQAPGAWRGEYFNNTTLSGTPALTRNEPTLDFNWLTGSPDPGTISRDGFSARWTRTLTVPADNYTFDLTTDDGARLWVNGQLLIDAWYDQAATLYTEDIFLQGRVTIEVEYYENTGYARFQLDWRPDVPGGPPTDIVVVDNGDQGFTTGGAAASWRNQNEGYDDDLVWTYNNDRVRQDYNWARWYPTLSPGRYEVQTYVPFRYTTTAQARYWVAHSGGLTLRIVDQSATGGTWVSLGTYNFQGDGSEYVSLADVTFEPYLTRIVGFDAVRWIPRP